MEELPALLGASKESAALISLDQYPDSLYSTIRSLAHLSCTS